MIDAGGPSSPVTGPAEQVTESKSVSSASPLASASVPASRRLPFDSLGGWAVMERQKSNKLFLPQVTYVTILITAV